MYHMLYGDTYIICMIICLVYIIIWPLMGQLRSWAARMASYIRPPRSDKDKDVATFYV